MNDVAISVEHLSKRYKLYNKPSDRLKEALGKKVQVREHYALHDVTFQIRKGECVGIIGTNGSGKSTVLKIITGVVNPTEGEVKVNGRISALLELGAGFNMEYTGLENIYLNGTMMGFSREEIDQKLDDILQFADIGDFVHQPVKTYSSGMFVRLAFAVAINVDPDVLIVDEALAVGDTRFQLTCMDKFLDFVNQGKTILFVIHDVNSIKRFCNRVIWMNQGKIIQDGNTDEVTDHYLDFLKSELPIEQYLEQCSDSTEEDGEVSFKEADVTGIDIAEIYDLQMYNAAGRRIDEIQHGEFVRLKVSYLVGDDTIENPVLGVAIRRIDNEYICGLNTKLDKEKISWKKGYNEIELEYPCFNLIGGEYYFDVGIFDKTGIVNLVYKAKIKSFFVKMDYIAEGIVVLNHKWNARNK